LNTSTLREEARDTITHLLFGDVRERCNQRKEQKSRNNIRKAITRYRKTCHQHNKTPCRQYIEELVEKHAKVWLMSISCYEPSVIEKYTKVVIHLWHLLSLLSWQRKHIPFQDHLIGTLYLLQHGIRIGKKTFYPKDTFLWRMLPPIQDLKHFGIARKSLTLGKNFFLSGMRYAYKTPVLWAVIISTHDQKTSPPKKIM